MTMIQTRGLPALCVLVLALTACNADRAPTPADGAAPAPPASAPTGTPPFEPAASSPAAPAPGDALARFEGYGDMRFGMDAAAAKQAWGGELKGAPAEGETCYHLSPTSATVPAELAFMIEDDRFVRYSTQDARLVAPGGGKVGMEAEELQALYKNALVSSPHKYSEGKYLSIAASGGAPSKLVFETDAAGKVTQWRVGVPPQVDYVEGCS